MSKRTLSDELQSVLLARSFDAPDAEDTIARTLAQTVDKATRATPIRRRRWPSGGLLTGAAVLILAVGVGAGFVKLTHDNGGSASSSSEKAAAQDQAGGSMMYGAQPSTGSSLRLGPTAVQAGPASPRLPASGTIPLDVSCPSGVSSTFSLIESVNVGSEKDLVVSAQCLSSNGARTASEVYTTAKSGSGSGEIRARVIQQSDGLSVQSITTGPSELTIQVLQLQGKDSNGSLQRRVYRTSDGGRTYQLSSNTGLSQFCAAGDLSATVVPGGGSSAVLQVRNTSSVACVISGYPGTRSLSLRGPNGGVSGQLVPIVLVQPGETASASIDQPARSVPCPSAPPALYLPTGAELTSVAFHASVNCQPVLHPYVAGSSGRG